MRASKSLAWTKPVLLVTALVFAAVADAGAQPCGNSVVQGGEQCDLGAQNGAVGSCCSATCTFRPSSTECRASSGVCDTVEFCTGASAACPIDGLVAAGVQCRGAAGSCDTPEACTGASAQCPEDALVPAGTECRGAAGTCDVAEFCDGSVAECPTDFVAAAGTTCGDGSDSVCDDPDSCDGAGSCVANHEPATVECRGSEGACDVAELCDGAGACPADGFAAAGTSCGDGADTVCDEPDSCDGAGSCLANLEPATTECRGAEGDCDLAEFCDGAGACPADGFAAVGSACGDGSETACDDPDSCDGSGSCLANFAAASTPCGDGSDSACDDPDSCDGSGSCLVNFEPATTECRGPASQCDVAELCDGAGSCPADALAAAGTPCGDGSDSACDAPDSCDASGSCLANFEPPTTECRSVAGDCDVAELCDGEGGCPTDDFAAAATVCRPLAGACDVAEACTGSEATCPPDGFREAGTECRSVAGACDVADSCTGEGVECADELAAAGTLCRPDAGECDVAEACTGSSGSCPADASIRVDFDEAEAPDAFASAAPLTNQYAALGVVWQGTGAVLNEAALPDLAGQSPPNFAGYADGESLLGGTSASFDAMDLACPSDEVSFLVGSESPAVFVAEAFDSIGNRLDDVGVQIDPDLRQVTLRGFDGLITRVEYEAFAVVEQGQTPRFAVDSIVVPEPGALGPIAGLLALGALTVIAGRTRR